MMPPYTYAAGRLAEERMQDTMRDGELARLIRAGTPAKFGFRIRAMATLGERLVALGKALQAQEMPSPAHFQDPALRGNR